MRPDVKTAVSGIQKVTLTKRPKRPPAMATVRTFGVFLLLSATFSTRILTFTRVFFPLSRPGKSPKKCRFIPEALVLALPAADPSFRILTVTGWIAAEQRIQCPMQTSVADEARRLGLQWTWWIALPARAHEAFARPAGLPAWPRPPFLEAPIGRRHPAGDPPWRGETNTKRRVRRKLRNVPDTTTAPRCA